MLQGLPLCRLIYASRVNAPVDLSALLAQAHRNNPPLGITGGLVCLDQTFLQYLEGPTGAVEALFERMLLDPRHHGVKVLERRTVPRRMFADWSMAALVWTETTREIYQSFSPGRPLDLYETDPSTA